MIMSYHVLCLILVLQYGWTLPSELYFILIIWESNKYLINDSYQLHVPHNSLLSFITYQKKKISAFFLNQNWSMLHSKLPLDSCSLKFMHCLFSWMSLIYSFWWMPGTFDGLHLPKRKRKKKWGMWGKLDTGFQG